MPLDVWVEVDQAALRAFLRSAPIVDDLTGRTEAVERSARRRVRSQSYRTGHLYDSIFSHVGEDGDGPYGDVGATVFYAPFVEFGTKHVPARPFLRPALRAAKRRPKSKAG